jgi:serine/threonine protein kinase
MDHMMSGLSELHRFGIIHRDIKPQNLLIAACQEGRYMLKIADFGLGRRSSANLTSFTPETQTMLYRAPELFTGVPKYCEAIDIWSAGCVFAEMLRGEPLFRGSREIELFQFIIRYVVYLTCTDNFYMMVALLVNQSEKNGMCLILKGFKKDMNISKTNKICQNTVSYFQDWTPLD